MPRYIERHEDNQWSLENTSGTQATNLSHEQVIKEGRTQIALAVTSDSVGDSMLGDLRGSWTTKRSGYDSLHESHIHWRVEPAGEVKLVEFIEPEPPYARLESVSVGDRFRIRVVFRKDPEVDAEPVTVRTLDGGAEISVVAKPTDNPLVFLTEPIEAVPDIQL